MRASRIAHTPHTTHHIARSTRSTPGDNTFPLFSKTSYLSVCLFVVVLVEAAAELLTPQCECDGEDAVDDEGQEGDGAEDRLLEMDVEYAEYDEALDEVGDKHGKSVWARNLHTEH